VTDLFALVGLPARPGWDEEEFAAAYRRLAGAWHPDAPGGDAEKFRQLQEARRVLGDPAMRLRHLLALSGEVAPSAWRPDGELFLQVGGIVQAGQALRRRAGETRTPIGRAAVRAEVAAWQRGADPVETALERERAACAESLADLDRRWPEVAGSDLADLAARWTFLGRWTAELRELRFALTAELGS
jgi:curved DNA-binding protein CbpA